MSEKDLKSYIDGFSRFKNNWYNSHKNVKEVFGSQSPKVLVIACSDSRVDPAILFDCDPGDFFVIRNVASLVPPYQKDNAFHGISAALEYAVRRICVGHIIILGHTHCAGISSLLDESYNEFEFVGPWLDIANPALLRINVMEHSDDEARHRACEREAILVSMGNLLTFPWLKERVNDGTLRLHGWYFNMMQGSLERWNPKEKAFVTFV